MIGAYLLFRHAVVDDVHARFLFMLCVLRVDYFPFYTSPKRDRSRPYRPLFPSQCPSDWKLGYMLIIFRAHGVFEQYLHCLFAYLLSNRGAVGTSFTCLTGVITRRWLMHCMKQKYAFLSVLRAFRFRILFLRIRTVVVVEASLQLFVNAFIMLCT